MSNEPDLETRWFSVMENIFLKADIKTLVEENEKLRAAASILINVMTLLEDASRDDVAREHCSEALKQYREAVGE